MAPFIVQLILKGHSQLMHKRIRYYFLADLHVTRHAPQTEFEKRSGNTQNKPCRVELVTLRIHRWICPGKAKHQRMLLNSIISRGEK